MKSLKLNQIEKSVLSTNEMNQVTGGDRIICTCSCYWAGTSGGSSTHDNAMANAKLGIPSKEGSNEWVVVVPSV